MEEPAGVGVRLITDEAGFDSQLHNQTASELKEHGETGVRFPSDGKSRLSFSGRTPLYL